MKKYVSASLLLIGALALNACASKEQIAQTIKENPEILYDAMKKDPAGFMEALQSVAEAGRQSQMQKMRTEREDQIQKDLKNPRPIEVDPARILVGEASAPITIVKYADFQCPACKMGFSSLEEIKKKYAGKIRFVHKNIPLPMHPQAKLAAEIFEALVITNKDQARAFYKLAYETQGSWRSEEATWALLKKIGGDRKKVEAEIKKGTVEKRIAADVEEHEKLGFEGTPAYMINGVALYGAQSAPQFAALIDQLLKK